MRRSSAAVGGSVIPAAWGRPSAKPPAGRYRRRMKRRLHQGYCAYGQRWQVEAAFSMPKRRLGSTLQARSHWARCREQMLLVLTYNFMPLVVPRFSTEQMKP